VEKHPRSIGKKKDRRTNSRNYWGKCHERGTDGAEYANRIERQKNNQYVLPEKKNDITQRSKIPKKKAPQGKKKKAAQKGVDAFQRSVRVTIQGGGSLRNENFSERTLGENHTVLKCYRLVQGGEKTLGREGYEKIVKGKAPTLGEVPLNKLVEAPPG